MATDVADLMQRLHRAVGRVSVELSFYGDRWSIYWLNCQGADIHYADTLEECVAWAEEQIKNGT